MKKLALTLIALPALVLSSVVSAQEYPAGFSERSIKKLERKAAVKKPGSSAGGGLKSVCKRVSPLRALMKPAAGGHITNGDPRASGYAFVCSRAECPRKFPASAYYSDGALAFKLGYYGTWEVTGRPRAYCAAGGVGSCSVSGVTRGSRASGRDGKVYISFGDGSCRSANPATRNGSPF